MEYWLHALLRISFFLVQSCPAKWPQNRPYDNYREGLGRIDLPVGKLGEFVNGERKHGTGISKIRAKHDEDLEHLSDTLTFGEILRTRHYDKAENPENPNRKAIVHKGFVCFVTKNDVAWEISTHYKPKDDTVANLKTIAEAL